MQYAVMYQGKNQIKNIKWLIKHHLPQHKHWLAIYTAVEMDNLKVIDILVNNGFPISYIYDMKQVKCYDKYIQYVDSQLKLLSSNKRYDFWDTYYVFDLNNNRWICITPYIFC
jgi:hypothetical protein